MALWADHIASYPSAYNWMMPVKVKMAPTLKTDDHQFFTRPGNSRCFRSKPWDGPVSSFTHLTKELCWGPDGFVHPCKRQAESHKPRSPWNTKVSFPKKNYRLKPMANNLPVGECSLLVYDSTKDELRLPLTVSWETTAILRIKHFLLWPERKISTDLEGCCHAILFTVVFWGSN
jgi:hypothetical protein